MAESQVDEESHPRPLEPCLSALIVSTYRGPRDEKNHYHTTESNPLATAEFVGGHTYEGEFKYGMMQGQGTYRWEDGTQYEGSFLWNTIQGRGKYTWSDGSTYEGDVADGLRHGTGVFTGLEGFPTYEGGWCKGVRHGRGVLFYDAAKETFYDGDWRENHRHGKGKMVWKPEPSRVTSLPAGGPRKREQLPTTGNSYDGDWEDDVKSGFGVMIWHDKNERYEGDWKNDLQNGHGEHVWMDSRPEGVSLGTQKQMCNRYVGSWLDGQRHGKGVFYYANGSRYDGDWQHNTKQGYGVFTYEDGHTYEGPFRDDKIAEPDKDSTLSTDETLQRQIHLHIADLLPIGSDVPEETRRLEKTVLRYTSELKLIYKRYSSREGGLGSSTGVFAMSMAQFKCLWADCSFASYDISLVYVYRLLAALKVQETSEVARATLQRRLREEQAEPSASASSSSEQQQQQQAVVVASGLPDRTDTYASDQPLLFREFVELLCRIAVAAHSHRVPALTPAEAFKQLMTHAVQSNHSKPVVNGSFEHMFSSAETRQALNRHRAALRKAFDSRATPDGRLSLRRFIKLFAELRGGEAVGIAPRLVLRYLVVGHGEEEEHPLVADPTLLDSEMVWDEFLEALAHIALQARPAEAQQQPGQQQAGEEEGQAGEEGDVMPPAPLPLHRHLEALLENLRFDGLDDLQSKTEELPRRPPRAQVPPAC